tara:strand:- start:20510 stop:20923 length:414 start_codon:yes stop_codon:yes gene_type:complete
MSFWNAIFSIGTGNVLQPITDLVDELHTSEEEKIEAGIVLAKLQTAINTVEANHRSVFVAGWRPWIGWSCGLAVTYHFLVAPLLVAIIQIIAFYSSMEAFPLNLLPTLDMASLMTLLGGMLGLGALRTREKQIGVTR